MSHGYESYEFALFSPGFKLFNVFESNACFFNDFRSNIFEYLCHIRAGFGLAISSWELNYFHKYTIRQIYTLCKVPTG